MLKVPNTISDKDMAALRRKAAKAPKGGKRNAARLQASKQLLRQATNN